MSVSCAACTAVSTRRPRQVRITTRRIPSGPRGTDCTVDQIRSFILTGAKDFTVRRRVLDVLMARGVRPRDYLGEIKALFEWVQHNIRYTRDPHRVELLHSARRMLELRAGDCDDMTILLGAMLQSIGHPVRIVVVGPNPMRPRLFTHVYPEVQCRGRWIAVDATMPHPMGWAPRAVVKKIISLRRRPTMSLDAAAGGLGQAYAPTDLIEAVRAAGVQPRDPRVKATWDLLRSRGLLPRDPWVRWLLRYIWERGLPARNRPRTAARLDAALRSWGLLAYGVPVTAPSESGVPYYPSAAAFPIAPYYPHYPRRFVGPWRPRRWPGPWRRTWDHRSPVGRRWG